MKKISVIIPVYNAEKYINKTIESITKQTIFNQLEIFFINDGSTDGSLTILENVRKDNVNIINKENGGVSSARNVGISESTAKYLCFVDADDYLEDDYFETLLDKSEYDLVANGYTAEYPSKKVDNKLDKDIEIKGNEEIILNFLKGTINPNSWGKLFKKELIGNLRFDENLSHSEDRLFVFEYLRKCQNIYIQSNLKYHYVIHNESAMRKEFNKKMFHSVDVMEKISKTINDKFPKLYNYAKSSEIDAKCRVLSELYFFKEKEKYNNEVKKLKSEIRKYNINKKMKYSTKKHFFAFLLIRISPYIYNFFKFGLKLQYK